MAFTDIGSAEQQSGATTKGSSSPISLTVAVPDLGANSIGVVLLNIMGGSGTHVISDVTWGGATMGTVVVSSGTTQGGVYLYRKVNPANNGNQEIVVSFSAPATAATLLYQLVVVYAKAGSAVSDDDTSSDANTTQNPYITNTCTQSSGNELVISSSRSTANAVGSPSVTDCTELQSYDSGGNCSIAAYSIPTSSGDATHRHNYSESGTYNIVMASFMEADANESPVVALNTANDITLDTTPTVEFTGTDPDGDAVRYNVQITDNPDAWTSGSELEDNYTSVTGYTGQVHQNPLISGLTWENKIPVDDRCGQSFTGNGGILDKVSFYFGSHEDYPERLDGTAVVRVYAHSGVYGTSSAPANAVTGDSLPTPDWLAQSDSNVYDETLGATKTWRDFTFSGANRIRLGNGTYYVAILDWWPNDRVYENAITILSRTTDMSHAGNAYLDAVGVNNGVWSLATGRDMDFPFRVYESYELLDKVSGTDAGFANTVTPADTDPFNSGEKCSFTVQAGDSLDSGVTYRWRVKGVDPSGSTLYGAWATARSFLTGTPATAGEIGSVWVVNSWALACWAANSWADAGAAGGGRIPKIYAIQPIRAIAFGRMS